MLYDVDEGNRKYKYTRSNETISLCIMVERSEYTAIDIISAEKVLTGIYYER